jgi:two-component system heavy metal sensor histidine kinase CusS
MQDVVHHLESAEDDPPTEEIGDIRRSIETENVGRPRNRLGVSVRASMSQQKVLLVVRIGRRDEAGGHLHAREEAAAVVEFFSAVADEKRITLSVDGKGTAFADRALLRRALSNLVGNALQHTDPRGGVRVVISQDEESTRVEVHDTGAGIESRHLGRLFDRFYRVDEARSSYPDGTGLGLSIVRSIMTLHGGTVSVASEPGRGSIFTLIFPGR